MLLFFQARSLQHCKGLAEATGPEHGFLCDGQALWKAELRQLSLTGILRRFPAVPSGRTTDNSEITVVNRRFRSLRGFEYYRDFHQQSPFVYI
jgi:hypothetical protein